MKVFEAMARAFHAEGVRNVFSLMGDANMMWLTAFDELDSTTNYFSRNEAGAVAMADGYARAIDEVGVCSVTCGPGLTQVGTSLVAAVRYRCPLVMFAGDTPRGDIHGVQYLDQARFAEACEARVISVRTASGALSAVREAFEFARLRRAAVVVNVPIDVQEEDLGVDYDYSPSTASLASARRVVPDPDQIDEAAGILALARRPIVVVGRGALLSGAGAAIEKLAARIGALTATTMLAKGALDRSGWSLGIAGEFASDTANEMFTKADVVLAVGASLNLFTTQGGHLFKDARVVHVSDDPSASLSAVTHVTCSLVGDARRSVELIDALLAEGSHSAEGFRTTATREALQTAETNQVGNGEVQAGSEALDPRHVTEVLEAAIPDDAIVVQGAGHFWSFPIARLSGGVSRRYIFTNGFGAVGQALPIAIGAAVADPSARVVAIEGDTSLMMNVQEIDTAARYGLDVSLVVMNDGAVGAEFHKLAQRGASPDSALIRSPRFDEVARSLGAEGVYAQSIAILEEGLGQAHARSGPTVFDVPISRDVVAMDGITIPSYTARDNDG